MIKQTIIHKCKHSQEHNISENGRHRIIARLEVKLCSKCNGAIIDLIKQGKHREALKLKHTIEGAI